MRTVAIVVGVLLAWALVLGPRAASAEPARTVYVGIHLRDVTRFDQRNGTFDVDVEAWVKWLGDFDPTRLRVANEASLSRDNLGGEDDGDWHVRRWRLRGTLRGEFPLHRFPFDAQSLGVDFELPERDAVLAPDLTGSGMETHFSVTGWNYDPHFHPRASRSVYASDLGSLAHEGQRTTVHHVRFEVTLRRPAITVALKLFMPLALLLLVALVALTMPVDLVDTRTGIGVTALLACFAFQFTVGGTIPDVAYLTVADALFILAYAITVLALLCSVAAYWLHRHNHNTASRRLDLAGRYGLPLATVCAALLLLRAPPAAPPPPAPRLAAMPRDPSSRPTVRVGLSQLPSLMTGAVTWGTRWGLVQVTPDDARVAFLAEVAPAVGNDALRLRADGRFEVRWHLREGLRWSDGRPVTSDDFRFALEVSPDPRVLSVHTPDARTLTLTYDGVVASALDGVQPLPRHALGAVMRRGGYDAVANARRTRPLPSTGPYRVVSFTPEREAVLEANPYFIGPAPSIRRVELQCVADHAALVRAFEHGELDLIAPSALTVEEADALGARVPGVVLQRPSNQMYALQPDPSVALLKSLAVREALLQAIDRAALARALFGDEGRVAHAPTPDATVTGAAAVPFDVERARATLARENLAGQTLRLTHGTSPLERTAAGLVADAWRAVGVRVELRPERSLRELSQSRAHGGMLLQAIMADRDTETRRFWNLPRGEGRVLLAARTAVFDDTVAALTEREERALFPERREQLRARLQVLFSQRLPILPLVMGSERYVVSPALRGWDRGAGVRFGEGIEGWYFTGAP